MGIDRLDENGTLFIKCKSIQNDKKFMDQLNIDLGKSKNVQVDLNYFAVEIYVLPGDQYFIFVFYLFIFLFILKIKSQSKNYF